MYYNQNQGLINQLERQKDNIDNLLYQYSQPTPVQNIINTGSDFEARFINENEDISNIPIMKKTLFIVDNYVKFTKAFIKDEDAPEDKVYMYFTKVV